MTRGMKIALIVVAVLLVLWIGLGAFPLTGDAGTGPATG